MKKRYYCISDDPGFDTKLIVDKDGFDSHFDMIVHGGNPLNEPWCIMVIEMEEEEFLNLPEFEGW